MSEIDALTTETHPADRLIHRMIALKAPICVGLDPVLERLPDTPTSGRELLGIRDFCLGIFDAIAPVAPCVKLQSACFERYGHEGVRVLEAMIGEAEQRELEVILDFKRGDIGISAAHYATAAFGSGKAQPAWVTISAYLGSDGITPFLSDTHGAFALVRTSNPSSDAIQDLHLSDGRTVAEAVAAEIASVGREYVSGSGYSALGAVVGATKPHAAEALRALMPEQIFLVPGFGAQGGGADDVKPCFKPDGTGAIITASRSVIYAFESGDSSWKKAVRDAALRLADEVGRVAGLR